MTKEPAQILADSIKAVAQCASHIAIIDFQQMMQGNNELADNVRKQLVEQMDNAHESIVRLLMLEGIASPNNQPLNLNN